jgi:hypothetical protein
MTIGLKTVFFGQSVSPEAASLRAKIPISLTAFGEVRPQVLGNFVLARLHRR